MLSRVGTYTLESARGSFFSHPPSPSRRIAAVFSGGESMTDNSMISVYPFGDEFYTFTEAPFIHRIDPATLETMNKVTIVTGHRPAKGDRER